jgi:hypothetical protein
MGFNEDLANANQMAAGSALQLQALGRMWRVYVGLRSDNGGANRQQLIDAVNAVLDNLGLGLRVGRGFQAYDPVVRAGKPSSYANLCRTLAGKPDGGKQDALHLYQWARGERDVTGLSTEARDLGVIVMFAEVGRGYSGSLMELFNHWGAIAQAATSQIAAQLWQLVPSSWAPATTYKDDLSAAGLYVQ